ncbi:MAG: hypothetical protein M3O65_01990 [Actinomycetota bacterium]|nr:hypothetical protein [Actinomycetota bacterium]
MTIRPRRGGYQIIVYAGIDRVTAANARSPGRSRESAKPSPAGSAVSLVLPLRGEWSGRASGALRAID